MSSWRNLLAIQVDVEELANACEVVAQLADTDNVALRARFGGQLGGEPPTTRRPGPAR